MARLSTFVAAFHDAAAVAAMPYRAFGGSGRVVSHFSFGASALGGVFSDVAVDGEEAIEVAVSAVRAGVNLIDVAPWYGFGAAERVLGAALRRVPRQAYYLHTKVGRYDADIVKRFDFSYERTLRSIDESLERLGLDYIDTIQGERRIVTAASRTVPCARCVRRSSLARSARRSARPRVRP